MLSSQPKQVRKIIFGLALLVALVVVFVVWGRQGLVDNRPDPYSFSAMGKSLANGDGFGPDSGTLLRRRAPLYPLFVAAIYTVGGQREILVQLAQCVLFASIAMLAYDIGRRVFNERTGRLAGAACLLHPALLRYVSDFHLETLMAFMCTLTVWFSVRFVERPNLGRAASLGVVTALTCLTKAVMLGYPAVFAALWLWRGSKPQTGAPNTTNMPNMPNMPNMHGLSLSRLVPLAVLFAALALTIAPWTVRNYRSSGHFVPISTGLNDAFLRGYVFSKTEYVTLQKPPYTDAENEVNQWFAKLCAAEGAVCEADDYQTDRILAKEARAKLFGDPLLFVRKALVGVFAFWYEMTSLATSLVAGLTALVAWGFAAVGLRRAWHEGQRAWLLLAPILYLNFSLALLLALGRYSVPILPCLMVLAAFGVDTLLGERRVPLVGGPTSAPLPSPA